MQNSRLLPNTSKSIAPFWFDFEQPAVEKGGGSGHATKKIKEHDKSHLSQQFSYIHEKSNPTKKKLMYYVCICNSELSSLQKS